MTSITLSCRSGAVCGPCYVYSRSDSIFPSLGVHVGLERDKGELAAINDSTLSIGDDRTVTEHIHVTYFASLCFTLRSKPCQIPLGRMSVTSDNAPSTFTLSPQ